MALRLRSRGALAPIETPEDAERLLADLDPVQAAEFFAKVAGTQIATTAQPAVAALRGHGVSGPGPDRFLSIEMRAAERAVRDGSVLAAVEAVTGPLD